MGADDHFGQPFDVRDVLARRGNERYELHRRYLNPQLPRMLHAIGFDKVYARGRGCLPLRRRRRRVPRHARRLRRVRPRAPQPGRPAGDPRRHRRRPRRSDPVRRPATRRPAGRSAAREGAPSRPGLLRQQRHRSGRGGAEVRPLRHRPSPHHLLRPRLSRSDRRLTVGERVERVPEGLRPDAARHRDPVRRPAGARDASCGAATSPASSSSRSRARASPSPRPDSCPRPRSCCAPTRRC